MKLECRYTFRLPEGQGLLVKRLPGESPEEWRFATNRDDVAVFVHVPAKEGDDTQDAPIKVASNEVEGWEVWAAPAFRVHVLTESDLDSPDPQRLKQVQGAVHEQTDPLAIAAASSFLRTARWRTGQFWLPERLTSSSALLTTEYYLDGTRIPSSLIQIVGGLPAVETALSQSSIQMISSDLVSGREPPLSETLLLDAMQYQSLGDHRVALILAAVSLEIALADLLRSQLARHHVAAKSQIDKFLQETSNRQLCTVVLGLLKKGNRDFRERCRDAFDLRNRAMHGRKKSATLQEASNAITAAREMIDLAQGST